MLALAARHAISMPSIFSQFAARCLDLLPRAVSDVIGGETLRAIDTPITGLGGVRGTFSLRLKRRRRAPDELYAVLALLFTGNRQYIAMSADEFDEFAGNVQLLLGDLHVTQQATGVTPLPSGRGVATSLLRAMSPDALRTFDMALWNGRGSLSLRLKRDEVSSELYVVLACQGGARNWFYPVRTDEFEQFAEAVKAIRNEIRPLVHPSLQPW